MSTVRAVNFRHPSSVASNIVLASDGSVSGGVPAPYRNMVYNGAMQIHQRGTSTSGITGTGFWTADRWATQIDTCGTWTQSVETDAPTGSGFRKSLRMLCTTSATPAASKYAFVHQPFEGHDLQRIAKGTASAQPITVSFWVKSNVPGTYIVQLNDFDNSGRSIQASYTIMQANTWEREVVTFPADTTGILDNDNNLSMYLRFWLAAGTDFTSGTLSTTSWTTTFSNWAGGQVNLAASVNNYWQVTGVQLETGSVPSQYEFKPYGQDLRECHRYFFSTPQSLSYRATPGGSSFSLRQTATFPVPMRGAPGITVTFSQIGTQNATTSTFGISTTSAVFEATTPNSTAWGNPHYDIQFVASAEL